jgi:hypothetical protein
MYLEGPETTSGCDTVPVTEPRLTRSIVTTVEQETHTVRWFWQQRRRPRDPVEDQWGRSECIDPDNVGDIADEGAGHRG